MVEICVQISAEIARPNVQLGSTQVLIEDDDSKELKFTLLTFYLCNDFIF